MGGSRIRVLSELDPAHEGFDVTDAATMRALHEAERRHFWHRTRNAWIAARLGSLGVRPPARIVELGCGAGCVAAHLSDLGYDVVGVDGQRALLEIAAERAPRVTLWQHDLGRGVGELPERGFDAAGMFDVLEHLDAPDELLAEAALLVRPGGLVVGTVPALRALWSSVDARAGHRVRYERESLRALVEAVPGLRVVEVVELNRLLVPLMLMQRRFVARASRAATSRANLAVPPWPINAAFAAALGLERAASPWLERAPVRLPGASLWFALRGAEARARVPRGGVEPPT